MSNKIFYIAGKMTGVEDFNREAFMAAEEMLQMEGHATHNPIRIGESLRRNMEAEPTWEDYMAACSPYLINSTDLFLLDGWEHSRGAHIEFVNAKLFGLKLRFQGK